MYSDIDDNQLDQLVLDATNQHPGFGIRMLKGYLKGKGHRLQWQRIRLSLLRTDPIDLEKHSEKPSLQGAVSIIIVAH